MSMDGTGACRASLIALDSPSPGTERKADPASPRPAEYGAAPHPAAGAATFSPQAGGRGAGRREPGPKAVEKPWHVEAKRLRAEGFSFVAIAARLGKSPPGIRWVLDENGEREATRERARRSQAAHRDRERRAPYERNLATPTPGPRSDWERPHQLVEHYRGRRPRQILPAPAIKDRAVKAFARGEIAFAELSRILRDGEPSALLGLDPGIGGEGSRSWASASQGELRIAK
ncbi:MAG TPA: hypothetical protein VKA12_13965 [Roseiarcus sp.]|nr:hypothetical protein [Roseiarcus sp.]